MYKKALYAVCDGSLCHAAHINGTTVILTRENGRIIRRQMTGGGKIFGARSVSYGDAFYEFPFATLEILGEETVYADKTGAD